LKIQNLDKTYLLTVLFLMQRHLLDIIRKHKYYVFKEIATQLGSSLFKLDWYFGFIRVAQLKLNSVVLANDVKNPFNN